LWGNGYAKITVDGQEIGTVQGISSDNVTLEVDSNTENIIRQSMASFSVSMEGRFRLKESKRLSPTLRKHFKDVRIGDQLYE